jgi:hypothetical protein
MKAHLWLVIFAAATIVAPAAHAFTVEPRGSTNPDGSPKFTDPDDTVAQFGSGGAPTQPGGNTFRFEVRPSGSDQQKPWVNPLLAPNGFRDNR